MSTIVYNMDCMEGMKQYPDNYFDLAIVDPPYGAGLGEGGGGKGWFAKYWDSENHEVSGGGTPNTGTGSVRGSTDTNRISRNGFHGKQYSQGSLPRSKHQAERKMGFPKVEGTRKQKNHFVGCAA